MLGGMSKLRLKAGAKRARVLRGHPWVYVNELESTLPESFNGQAVELEDSRGRSLGMGLYNGRSQIAWRRYTTGKQPWDEAYIQRALEQALRNREDEPYRRVVWSEADDLPGLIVDQYNDVLVVQAQTAGVDASLPMITEQLQALLEPAEVLFRNDAPTRQLEGLKLEVRTLSGKKLAPAWHEIYGLKYYLDLEGSHKTGFYLDQRQEHFKVSTLVEDWRVLDAFCNQGAFGLNCARAGAREVLGLDSSGEAIAKARENAQRNQLDVAFEEVNVFDWLTEHSKEERFDLIILDPPSFARNKASVKGAMRGYKQINLRALQMLNPGGILATYSCSQHVSRELFLDMLADAAHDAGRKVQLLYQSTQPIDHPVRLNFPESEYLKGALLRVD
ncbi:MAG: 23S rRNA (cytosine1962-C5)-methyltransferase [Puniceicoccaceae bacterium 5H]|nr:MAG: 23S rRNA (cytosine1962-C5)-methyltransferase [Puniceicoccaceae bacterium 5H]